MWTPRIPSIALSLSALALFSACSSQSGSSPSSSSFYIDSCTLGCTDGIEGDAVNCAIANTYQNQEISIIFSEPFDLFSVNSSSFRVTDVANGTTPSGQFFSDPTDPRRLIFRPSLTFDQNGTPVHGLASSTSYKIFLPGVAQMDQGPYIQSTSGVDNMSRMQCTIKTTEGIIDPVPGRPAVMIFADQVAGYQPDGTPIIVSDVLVNGGTELTNVYRQTRLRFEFDDIMNVATLLNPSTGASPNIDIELDEDGDLSTDLDRTPIDGMLTYLVDLEMLSTSLYFTSDVPLPSAGPNAPLSPRRIVLTLPPAVQDLVANPIDSGGGTHSFITELPQLGEVLVPDGGEDFLLSSPDPNSNEDGPRSGAFWGGGRLTQGVGGGSGRLGDLRVPSGSTLTLNTDSQVFPLGASDGLAFDHTPDFLGNADAVNFPGTLGNYPDSITVTDGVFEFQSLTLEAGSNLVFAGTQPARIYIRGKALLTTGSLLDLSGPQPADHDSSTVDPETELPAPTPSAGGGDGGFGGDRFDMSVNGNMAGLGLCENDVVANPGTDTQGRSGMGVGRSAGLGGGVGGVQYPANYPTVNINTTVDNNNHGLGFNRVDDYNANNAELECRSLMVGGVGSGGAYALDGGVGTSDAVLATAGYPAGQNNGAPDTPGGDSSWLETADDSNAGYNQRLLNWWDGFLLGGSGGGGGGNHPNGTLTWRPSTGGTNCIGGAAFFRAWHDHSGAMGGTGGGAIQITAGKSLIVDGRIDARGGLGGQARLAQVDFMCDASTWSVDFGQFATPGGGGSGGAVKLQSMVVDISPLAGTIDISGGSGGLGVWSLSQGGDGSPGLLRVEDMVGGVTRSLVAQSVLPYESLDDSLSWISVDNGQDPIDGPGWTATTHRPDSVSASMSCWLQPTGTFFSLLFVEDEEPDNTGDPDKMGWNMDILYNPGGTGEITIPFRGANGGVLTNSWENEFGISLGTQGGLVAAAPIVIRFQGARTDGSTDLCNADVNDLFAGIDPNSVTPWVDHPSMFNDFPIAPNMIRFAVVFDGTSDGTDVPGDTLADVVGLTNLRVRVVPD
ncbi:MAG: hypothetical protein OSB57_06865 [Planctomycetota bacterium]|nr:hypothetical protein [Planctomycetota bacterium]